MNYGDSTEQIQDDYEDIIEEQEQGTAVPLHCAQLWQHPPGGPADRWVYLNGVAVSRINSEISAFTTNAGVATPIPLESKLPAVETHLCSAQVKAHVQSSANARGGGFSDTFRFSTESPFFSTPVTSALSVSLSGITSSAQEIQEKRINDEAARHLSGTQEQLIDQECLALTARLTPGQSIGDAIFGKYEVSQFVAPDEDLTDISSQESEDEKTEEIDGEDFEFESNEEPSLYWELSATGR